MSTLNQNPPNLYNRAIALLENTVFQWVIAYATYPLIIFADILLIPVLIALQNNVVFVLVVNSYLNASSVALGSIILLQQLAHDKTVNQHQAELRTIHEGHHEERQRLHRELLHAVRQTKPLAPVPSKTQPPAQSKTKRGHR